VASDVTLYVADPSTGAMVVARWLGMSLTIDRVRSTLARPPDHSERGSECWGRLSASEALAIADASYADGPSPEEISKLAELFPSDKYWWIIHHDY